jgi:hypothetical protein
MRAIMKPTALPALLCLILLLTAGCAAKGILIPLENDLPDHGYTVEYLNQLNSCRGYAFHLDSRIGPDKPVAEWDDADYSALASRVREKGADLVSFGRVHQSKGYVGFLRPDATVKTDARFERVDLVSGWGRDTILEMNLNQFMRDKTAR